MAYEVVMSYHLHMPSYFLGTFTEYPFAMCQKKNPCKVLIYRDFFVLQFFPAERRGFEPRIPFWGIHAFQACLFNHSSTSPFRGAKVKEVFETTKYLV